MVVSIHQPNFLPWYGYFHKILNSDKFIFFDNVQMPRGKSFVSRTKILNNSLESWLTIPVLGKSDCPVINQVKIDNTQNWKKKHLRSIELNYKKANYFDEVYLLLKNIYQKDFSYLIDFNTMAIIEILRYLNSSTEILFSSKLSGKSTDNSLAYIILLVKKANGSVYFSGSGNGSKRYIDIDIFKDNDIEVKWQVTNQISYPQFNTRVFIPNLSIIDILFNHGRTATKVLGYYKE